MENVKHYYVTIDTKEISEVSIPDNGIEFEIIANKMEIKEIQELFRQQGQNSKDAVKYLAKPFDEWGADNERNRYDRNLMKLYQRLYELGTGATKSKINELGIIN